MKKLSRKTVQLNACCWLVRSRPFYLDLSFRREILQSYQV